MILLKLAKITRQNKFSRHELLENMKIIYLRGVKQKRAPPLFVQAESSGGPCGLSWEQQRELEWRRVERECE